MEDGTAAKPLTTKESEPTDTSSKSTLPKDPMVPTLMFLGCILATLSVIVAGYFHGNMHIEAVWKSLHA
ncbi:hypothetical protein T191209_162 [Synechococcus phage S-CAM22]|uniref:Uncharacterized protein n=1 Tax=Synechococcus phage S-CAM22 TaxID=1883365 RepID=A0A1D8KRZ8_9CAUD|nr:hypothetical protein BOW88_gp069 [Synechococcus phage S-CAM22]YP_010088823.1 hypothetical protein KNT15_gp069 [Synechococcus phage S-CAM22]AOV60994.1 hypothetical protein C350210_163 [Synechococcus phage S-CAM22]AOV61208.1 hypothetical protein N440310_162 [Synechococcus phage S-CAM22]AOV61422.1 hypothetical protein T191209_162 [Synechococcus phage S-CAM22]|tara:strand:+ start:380 stop:586 length:207 start_codon:yes stop_codon:yes gene_type:complete